ncbi:MAG: hypothetical protein J6P98_06045 [Clostridia bacterium]|nr:hypothetical protein [Clostridia bacterium]
MNLQPSLIIWTVICFCLFMLVFDRLLLRPLLSHMDARRERIDSARRRKAELEAEREREREERLSAAENARREALDAANAEYALKRRETEEELKRFSEKLAKEADTKKLEDERLFETERGLIEGALDDIASAYAEKLIKR